MRITIDPFGPKSINNAIKQVNQYEKDFVTKKQEFARRLAEVGVSVATAVFSTAEYDGENDVQVTSTQTGDCFAVVAYGKTVGFIEFGTGVKFEEYDSSTTEFKPPARGTYGKGKGANPKGWYYTSKGGEHSQHTYGNPPAEAMLMARDQMVVQVIQIAREVWK